MSTDEGHVQGSIPVELPDWLQEGKRLVEARVGGESILPAWDEWWKRHGSSALMLALKGYAVTYGQFHAQGRDVVTVPREPTEAMLDAVLDGSIDLVKEGWRGGLARVYRTMVAVAESKPAIGRDSEPFSLVNEDRKALAKFYAVTDAVRVQQTMPRKWGDACEAAWFEWTGTTAYAELLATTPIKERPTGVRFAQHAFAAAFGETPSMSSSDAQDAARYRFVRERAMPSLGMSNQQRLSFHIPCKWPPYGIENWTPGALDAAIDAELLSP